MGSQAAPDISDFASLRESDLPGTLRKGTR
jgi:hypothetical protein